MFWVIMLLLFGAPLLLIWVDPRWELAITRLSDTWRLCLGVGWFVFCMFILHFASPKEGQGR